VFGAARLFDYFISPGWADGDAAPARLAEWLTRLDFAGDGGRERQSNCLQRERGGPPVRANRPHPQRAAVQSRR
jgi:hypothetical protein